MATCGLGRERVRMTGVREERLRATADLRGMLNLTSWRGRSGRRYVVGVHALVEPELRDVSDAVLIAVRRDEDGLAQAIAIAAVGQRLPQSARGAWIEKARRQGATEMHVHRLAENARERQIVVEDLETR